MTSTVITAGDTPSPHERAARAHDAAAEAHERAEALIEQSILEPSEENEIIEAQQRSDAYQASQTAREAAAEANESNAEQGAALCCDAALREAYLAAEAFEGSEGALKRHRAAALAHRAASAGHRAGE